MKHVLLTFIFVFSSSPLVLQAQEFEDAVQTAVGEKDYSKAFESARINAQRGDPKAQGELGLLYEKG